MKDLNVRGHAPDPSTRHLDDRQLAGLAQLVADGQEPFPQELAPDLHEPLRGQVRELRRTRLVNHIARQIALALQRCSAGQKGSQDDQAQC